MSPTDPWAFGLNHVLTIIGFVITLGIAAAGFRRNLLGADKRLLSELRNHARNQPECDLEIAFLIFDRHT